MLNVYEQVDRNKRRSAIVIICFVAFVIGVGWIFAKAFDYGPGAMGLALIFSGLMTFSSYWWGDKLILTISSARPASKAKDFVYFTVVENLALAAQIPMPKLYVINDTALNAFATGRDPTHAVVCATRGLLEKLSRTELEGVISHELSHIRNFDTRLMGIVAILVGMITLVSDWMLRMRLRGDDDDSKSGALFLLLGVILAMLSPLIAQLIQLAVSRRQEYLADASGVMLTRYPEGLASALEKINADKEPLEAANKATAHLFITNPLKNRHDRIGWFASFFNTHPPIEKRVAILRQME